MKKYNELNAAQRSNAKKELSDSMTKEVKYICIFFWFSCLTIYIISHMAYGWGTPKTIDPVLLYNYIDCKIAWLGSIIFSIPAFFIPIKKE